MISEIAQEISGEVIKTLDNLINKHKEKEGLVSIKNMMIVDLKIIVNNWFLEQVKEEKKIDELLLKELKESFKK